MGAMRSSSYRVSRGFDSLKGVGCIKQQHILPTQIHRIYQNKGRLEVASDPKRVRPVEPCQLTIVRPLFFKKKKISTVDYKDSRPAFFKGRYRNHFSTWGCSNFAHQLFRLLKWICRAVVCEWYVIFVFDLCDCLQSMDHLAMPQAVTNVARTMDPVRSIGDVLSYLIIKQNIADTVCSRQG